MVLADRYNVRGLIRIYRDAILEILQPKSNHDPSTIVNTAILGYQLNDDILKEASMKKMVLCNVSLKELDDWEKLKEYPDLMCDIIEQYGKAKKT